MNDIQMKQLEQTLTSMEVAEMVEKTHANMLRDIKRYCKQMEQNNITGKIKIDVADFFNIHFSHRFFLPFVCCLTTIPKSGIIHVSTAFGGCKCKSNRYLSRASVALISL